MAAADLAWMDDGACANTALDVSDLFFPRGGHIHSTVARLCDGCAVRTQCLEHALETALQGVWGGTTYAERERMRAERNLMPLPLPLPELAALADAC